MKKIISLLFMVLSIGFIVTSCNDDDDDNNYPVDHDTIPSLYDFNNVSFNFDGVNNLYYFRPDFALYAGEHLLIYVQSGWDNNTPIWKLLPNNILYTATDANVYNMFLNYNFTNKDFEITAENSVAMPPELNGLNFRVIVIQTIVGKKQSLDMPDYNDYKAVIKYYKIDESKVKIIKP